MIDRVVLVVWISLATPMAMSHEHGGGHFVAKDEPREVEGITRPGRILVSSFDNDEFVFIDAESTSRFRTPLHIHHEHHEAVYVLSGKRKVTVGERTWDMEPGDFVFMPKGIAHRIEVLEPGRSLVVASPGYDEYQ